MPDIDVTQTAQQAHEPELAPGSLFAERYEILEKVGAGGMSVVYKANQPSLGRTVAVKLLHRRLMKDERAYQRFQREAHAASLLDHPNIVKVLAFGIEADRPFMAMEYLEGGSVADLLKQKGKLSADEAVAIILPAARAIDHAHRHGVIHRDIKPANIILAQQKNGERLVQLADFGIAKITESDGTVQSLTQTDAMVGTPHYMSPEQCERRELDARSDIYSLGCVLYELLKGEPPFGGDSVFAVLYSHIHDLAQTLPPGTPDWLAAITLKMMDKNPANRFQSMTEVVEALEHPSIPHAVSHRKKKKNKKWVPVAVASLVVAALGCAAFWLQRQARLNLPTDDEVSSRSQYSRIQRMPGTPEELLAKANKAWDVASTTSDPVVRKQEALKSLYALYSSLDKDATKGIPLAPMAQERIRKAISEFGLSPKELAAVRCSIDAFVARSDITKEQSDYAMKDWLDAARQLDPDDPTQKPLQMLDVTRRYLQLHSVTDPTVLPLLREVEPYLETALPLHGDEYGRRMWNDDQVGIILAWKQLDPKKGMQLYNQYVDRMKANFGPHSVEYGLAVCAKLDVMDPRDPDLPRQFFEVLPIFLKEEHIVSNDRLITLNLADRVVHNCWERKTPDHKGATKVLDAVIELGTPMLEFNPQDTSMRVRLAGWWFYHGAEMELAGKIAASEKDAATALKILGNLTPEAEWRSDAFYRIARGMGRAGDYKGAELLLAKSCRDIEKYHWCGFGAVAVYNLRADYCCVAGQLERALQYRRRAEQLAVENCNKHGVAREYINQYHTLVVALEKIVEQQRAQKAAAANAAK